MIVLLTILLGLSLSGCSADADSRPANERLIPAVEAVQARYGSLPLSERLSGLVRARNQVELYPQISAAVVQVYVENGDMVKAGQPLVRLRDTEFREQLKQAEASYQITTAQVKQAEAELQRIKAQLERTESLAASGRISSTELENTQTQFIAAEATAELARARLEQAQATVDERKEALSRAMIRAPVAGTVGNRYAEVGMLVTTNTRLFTLGQLDSVRVEVILTDRMLSYIKEDQRSEIAAPGAPGGALITRVARISPFLHPISHSTTAEMELANPEGILKPGMFVTVDILYGESERAMLVPLSAIWENPATASVGVFVSRDSLTGEPVALLDDPRGGALTNPVLFEFIPVEVIAKGKMSAGVRGVDPGSWVVTIGQDLLGADTGQARVRPVHWEWIEELQKLQREDLLQEILQRQQEDTRDTSLTHTPSAGGESAA
jgi:RND family efflux transporter MFP subunit